jgi:hypothetical protein
MKFVTILVLLCALPLLAMTPDEFAETTQRVIAADGFADYQPTAVFPARKDFRVLAGAPPDAKQAVGSEEFLVAFKVDSKHFKIIRSIAGQQTASKVYAVR